MHIVSHLNAFDVCLMEVARTLIQLMSVSHPSIDNDFTLVFKGHRVPICRCVFGLYSRKFRKLPQFVFSDEYDMTVDFVSKSSFKTFVDACQTECYHLTIENVFDVIYLCNEWDVKEVKKEAEKYASSIDDLQILVSKYLFLYKNVRNSDLELTEIVETLSKSLDKLLEMELFVNLPLGAIERIFEKGDVSKIDQHLLMNFIVQAFNIHQSKSSLLLEYLNVEDLTEKELENTKIFSSLINRKLCMNYSKQVENIISIIHENKQKLSDFSNKIEKIKKSHEENIENNKKQIKKIKNYIIKHNNEVKKSQSTECIADVMQQQDLTDFNQQMTQNKESIESLANRCNELDELYQSVSTMINSIGKKNKNAITKAKEKEKRPTRRSFFSKKVVDEEVKHDRRAVSYLETKPKTSIKTSKSDQTILSSSHSSNNLRKAIPLTKPLFEGKIIKEFNNDQFDGIISYLTQKCGGNVHNEGVIIITASSTAGQGPEIVCNFNSPWYWSSKNEQNSWIRFDFKNKKIKVSGYTLKTYPFQENKNHIKSWVVEGTNNPDNNSWEIFHQEVDNDDLNGFNKSKMFSCDAKKSYRYIRIRNIGPNHFGYNTLVIANVEFFGILE